MTLEPKTSKHTDFHPIIHFLNFSNTLPQREATEVMHLQMHFQLYRNVSQIPVTQRATVTSFNSNKVKINNFS